MAADRKRLANGQRTPETPPATMHSQALTQTHRVCRKRGRRKRAEQNSLGYEALELRRVLNAVPVGVNDLLYTTGINTPLNIAVFEDGLLANDFDLDHDISEGGSTGGGGYGGPLFVLNPAMLTTTVAGGTLSLDIDGDGTFTYTPPTNFSGFDYFSYQVADASSGGLTSPDTLVAISVGQSLTAQLNGPELIGDSLLHTGALLTTQTLGGGLKLIYRSDATPTPIVALETMLASANVPDSIEVEAVFNGISSGVTTYSVNPATFDPLDPFRFVQRINAPGLATGFYDWTMTVTLKNSGEYDRVHEFSGQQAVINRTVSDFGTGWWLAGLDRLHDTGGGMLLENADGSTYFFADNGAGFDGAVGDQTFATLVSNANGYTLTDKWGDSRTFNTEGRITSSKRLNSSVPDFTFQYVAGKLDMITDISDRLFDFTYNASGFLTHVVDFAGRTTNVSIAGGRLTGVVVANQVYSGYIAPQWTFGYQTIDGQTYLQSVTDPANATTSYQFHAQTRRLSLITHADASTWQLYPALTQGYIASGNVVQASSSDPRYVNEVGETFRFATNGFGSFTSFTDAESGSTFFEYDQHGQLNRETAADPDGLETEYEESVTRYGYSPLGDLVLVVNADDSTQIGTYTSLHRVQTWTNELGHVETFVYESDGDLQEYRDAERNSLYYEYDTYGNLTEERTENPSGPLTALITTYVYDPLIVDQLLSVQINDDPATVYTYTASDQIATSTDPLGRVTSYFHDPLDRLVRTDLPDPDDLTASGGSNGSQTTPIYTYTYASNLLIATETDPVGNVTSYGYDPDRHFLTSVTLPDPDGVGGPLGEPVTTYEYYATGLLHKEFRPEFTQGKHIEYFYDGNDNLISVVGPLAGQVTTFVYDLVGRLESETDASGRTMSYKYDSRDRVTSVIDHDPDGAGPLTGPTTRYEYDLAGQLTFVSDPLGRITAYVYYDNGLLHESLIQNPNPEAAGDLFGERTFINNSGQSIGNLQATVYVYDLLNRLVSTTDPAGRVSTTVYNQRGQIACEVAPDPNPDDMISETPTTFYEYNEVGHLLSVTDVLGRVTEYEFDRLDRRTKTILPDPDDYTASGGNNGPLESPEFTYRYDAVGNLLKTVDSLNREFITVYDNLYRPVVQTDRSNGSGRIGLGVYKPPFIADWHYTYNDQLQLAEVVDPEGASTAYQYDSAAQLISELDTFGNVTVYTWDLLNRPLTVTAPDPDGTGGPEQSFVTTYGYDIHSNLISIDGANGLVTQQFNAAGELTAVTDELLDTTRFAYDLLGRLVLETDALQKSTSHIYDIHGRLVRQADRNGNVTWIGREGYAVSEYWFENSLTPTLTVAETIQGGGGNNEVQTITISDADAAFRLAFGGEVTFYLNIGATAAEVATALESLHSIDDVSVTQTANGYTITFVGAHSNTDVALLVGDAVGQSDGDPVREILYAFDAAGRLQSVADNHLDASGVPTPASAEYDFTYDQLDRRLTQNEVIVGLSPAIGLTFGYDAVNRRTSLLVSIGGVADYKNTYEYDHLDRPTWVRQQSQTGGNAVAYKRVEFRYNDLGQLTYVNRFETPTTVVGTPSLRTVLEYDDANQIESITHRAAFHQQTTTLLNDFLFGFDDAGRIESIDSLLDGLSLFTFSTDNQLTVADHDPSRLDENYSYDANGNRIGGSYSVGAQNRTLSDGTFNYQYDNEGNRTRRTRISDASYEEFSYDFRNRLTEVKFFTAAGVLQQAVSYTYDAFNNLVRRQVDTDGDGAYDDLDQIFAGFDGNNSSLEFETADGSAVSAEDLSHRRLWGPLVDQLVSSEEVDSLISAGEVLWALQDQVGTIRDIGQFDPTAGPSGAFEIVSHRVYNSFGQLTDEYDPATQSPSSITLSHGFTGKFTDDLTDLTHHQNRWFDLRLGKWISEDPIGLAAGDINTTRYVGNDPLLNIDPTGLFETTTAVYGFGGTNGDAGDGGHGILAPDGFWAGYWHYLTHPWEMDADLETGFYVAVGTSAVCGAAAGGLAIAGVGGAGAAGGATAGGATAGGCGAGGGVVTGGIIARRVVLSGGRSGQNVKNLVGPPNSAVRGGGDRIFITNDKGQVILDITRDRVKPVAPGQGFGPKRPPTQDELSILEQLLRGGS